MPKNLKTVKTARLKVIENRSKNAFFFEISSNFLNFSKTSKYLKTYPEICI